MAAAAGRAFDVRPNGVKRAGHAGSSGTRTCSLSVNGAACGAGGTAGAGTSCGVPNPVRHTTVEVLEPEVLISPNQRIALEQLAAAMNDGRLTTESVAAANQPMVQEPLIVPSPIIPPFKADVLPAIGTSDSGGAGGGVIRRLASVVAAH